MGSTLRPITNMSKLQNSAAVWHIHWNSEKRAEANSCSLPIVACNQSIAADPPRPASTAKDLGTRAFIIPVQYWVKST
jgi:hypothetical protein